MDKRIQKYAELLIKKGINIQKDQTLVLTSSVNDVEFVHLLVEAAYDVGAREVVVRWNDDFLTRQRYLHAADDLFDKVHTWEADLANSMALEGAAFLSVSSRNPSALVGIDHTKMRRTRIATSTAMKTQRSLTNANKVQWCGAALPSVEWAKMVFPGVSDEEAYEKLWDAILTTVRVREDNDPVAECTEHTKFLVNRRKTLDSFNFKYLKYKNSLGTDLVVELPEEHFWDGAREITDEGVEFIPNMPTEEIFTSPKRDAVNGIVYSSKPLVVQGNIVNNFCFEFENGRIVNIRAEEGLEYLESAVNTDEGSHYLGEAALVPVDSPISESGLLFYSTLFDENAACHLAFGASYPTIKGASDMTEDERFKRGLNKSMTHNDFMIGTPDLSVIGVTHDGKEIPVFVDGKFAF